MATRTVGGGSGEGGGVGHGSGGVVSLHLFAGIKKSGRSVLPAHFLALLSLSRKSASALLPSTFHRYITAVLYSTEKEMKSKAKKEEKRKKRKKEEKEEKEKKLCVGVGSNCGSRPLQRTSLPREVSGLTWLDAGNF